MFDKIKSFLNENRVSFEEKEHAITLTSEDSARIRGDQLSAGAKAILYKVQDSFYLFVLAANEKMDTKKIKEYFKGKGLKAKKTRFASTNELLEMTGLVPGSVPPFGRPILDIDLYVDLSLLANEFISFNAGSLTHSIKMSLNDYMEINGATIFNFTAD